MVGRQAGRLENYRNTIFDPFLAKIQQKTKKH
jgi:hypothetical protein